VRVIAAVDAGTRVSNPGPSAIAAVLRDDDGELLVQDSGYLGDSVTNNLAEWSALVLALELAARLTVPFEVLEVRSDSRLVVQQALGRWRVRGHLKDLHGECQARARNLRAVGVEVTIRWVPREENVEADRIVSDLLDDVTGRKRGY
jgi:ribonuclease HI